MRKKETYLHKYWLCFRIAFFGITLVIGACPPAVCQDIKSEFTLDEIIVTAERRESSAQDTPVAVSAWDNNALDEQNIVGTLDLQMRMPSTYIGTNANAVWIRGIGFTSTYGLGADPGVGFFTDGFYNSEGTTALGDSFDYERIENVRGPQSTLYGKSTIAGAINIITKKPTREWSGQVKTTIGAYEMRNFHAAFGGPTPIENLYYRIRLSDIYFGGYQSYILYDDESAPTKDKWRVNGKLLYEPTENLSFYFAYDLQDAKQRMPANVIQDPWPTQYETFPGSQSFYSNPFYGIPVGYIQQNPSVSDPYKTANNTFEYEALDRAEANLTATLDMGNFTFKYLGMYRDWHNKAFSDYDSGPNAEKSKMMHNYGNAYDHSQELQVMYGGEDAVFTYLGGLYYFEQNRSSVYNIIYEGDAYQYEWNDKPQVFLPGAASWGTFFGEPWPDGESFRVYRRFSGITDISQAVFSQFDIQIADNLNLSVGGRYAIDRKKGPGSVGGPGQTSNYEFQKETWEEFLYKIGMDYKPFDGALVYGKYERGYKPGGFALSAFQKSFDAEYVNAYETGWKQSWMMDRFFSTLSAYYYDYQDLQLSHAEGYNIVVGNVSSSTNYGLELDITGFILKNLLSSLTYSYLNTEFGDFPGQYDQAHPEKGAYNPVTDRNEQNLEGNVAPYAPEHKVSLNGTYTINTDIGDFSMHALYFWQSEVFMNMFNNEESKADAYDRVDAELMWNSTGYAWRVTLWVKNAFDETTITNQTIGEASLGSVRTATYAPPRTLGIDISYKW